MVGLYEQIAVDYFDFLVKTMLPRQLEIREAIRLASTFIGF